MDIRQYFAEQLDATLPLTLSQIEAMRENRRQKLTPEQYEISIKASRLDTDELVGRVMLFYALRTQDNVPQDGFDRSVKIEMLRVMDDELDQLIGKVRFERMNNAIPIFEALV